MVRILAVIAFIVAVVLFAVYALNSAANAAELGWGLVAEAAGLACLALEGVGFSIGP